MINQQTTQNSEKPKLSFLAMVGDPLGITVKKIKLFLIYGGISAIVIALLHIIFGNISLCINSKYNAIHTCNSSFYMALVYYFLYLLLVVYFFRIWYQFVLLGQNKQQQNWFPAMADIKLLLLFVSGLALFALTVFGCYSLIVRKPNPNWRVELAFFTLVFSTFVLPFIGLSFSCWISFAAANKKLPNYKVIWHSTSNNFLSMLLGIIFLLLFFLFLNQVYLRFVVKILEPNSWMLLMFTEYVGALITCFGIASFANYYYLVQTCLFGDNKNDDTAYC